MEKAIEELSLMLSNSLCIQHCVGNWDNTVKYTIDGNDCEQRYTILLLIDYQHMYYHIGVAILKYDTALFGLLPQIINKSNTLIVNNPNVNKLVTKELHFTGKLFAVSNFCSINIEEEK